MAKDYNKIRPVNGLEDAIYQALADIAITGLGIKIKAYKKGNITARELLEFIENTSKELRSK